MGWHELNVRSIGPFLTTFSSSLGKIGDSRRRQANGRQHGRGIVTFSSIVCTVVYSAYVYPSNVREVQAHRRLLLQQVSFLWDYISLRIRRSRPGKMNN